LSSYTGVAARNISGMTLHITLSLGQKKEAKLGAKTKQDLTAIWEGIDYLFIDEVSMIGCKFLLDISKALSVAKCNVSAFGGINIIFAGDFTQLLPVGQSHLFSHLDTHTTVQGGTKAGQKSIMGKLLWLLVQTVMILTEIICQSGPENEKFVGLLSHLWNGKCTLEDYAVLSSHVTLSAKDIDFSDKA
jgi:hypothetical protein